MRNIKFYNGEYYYIYNRGVDLSRWQFIALRDKRNIFMDKDDYQRFLKDIQDFNNESNDS